MKMDKISPFTVSDPEQWPGWPSPLSTPWPRFTRAWPRLLSPPHGSSAPSCTACTLSEAKTTYILLNDLQIKGALRDILPSSPPHSSIALPVWTWAMVRRSEGVDESSLWLNANPLYSWCWSFLLTQLPFPQSLYQWEFCRTEGTFRKILALNWTLAPLPLTQGSLSPLRGAGWGCVALYPKVTTPDFQLALLVMCPLYFQT